MMVGMVDTSSLAGVLRASQRPPVPTPRNAVADVNRLMRGTDTRSGLSRADQDLSNRRGGELFLSPMSTLLDEAKNSGVVQRGTPLSAGLTGAAFVTDFLNPSFGPPIVGGAAQGVKKGVDVATDPTTHARLNSIMGRLYHGNRNEPWSVAGTRPFDERVANWFSADLFSTPDFKLASSYGPDAVYSLKNLPPNLKVLDLMPGGKTVAEQSPELAVALGRLMGGNKPFDDVADAARHTTLTNLPNDELAQLMQQYGFNALRHVSGQGLMGGKGRAKPVYAFFDPAGITASPVSPLNRKLYQAAETITDVPRATRQVAERVGNRFVDSVDEILRQSNSLNLGSRQFLTGRGTVVPGKYNSSGIATRLVTDPTTGRTTSVVYKPYPAVSGAIKALGAPGRAIKGAKEASLNAYQKVLDNYPSLEKANRQAFLESSPYGQQLLPSGNPMYSSNNLGLSAPMPPGYTPLPKPVEPGAFDFLKYLFNTSR
jgi:hypothetical protein